MTQFKPTLIIKRLVITRGVHRVYDEEFHSGVNVIRGKICLASRRFLTSYFMQSVVI